jgi:hypothetical protein
MVLRFGGKDRLLEFVRLGFYAGQLQFSHAGWYAPPRQQEVMSCKELRLTVPLVRAGLCPPDCLLYERQLRALRGATPGTFGGGHRSTGVVQGQLAAIALVRRAAAVPLRDSHPRQVVGQVLGGCAAQAPAQPRLHPLVVAVDRLHVIDAVHNSPSVARRNGLGRHPHRLRGTPEGATAIGA